MRFLAIILLVSLFFTAAFSQSTKPKAATTKPKPGSGKTRATQSTPTPVKPKPAATPAKKLSEKDEWEKANAIADMNARVTALKKFVVSFPSSTRNTQALGLISAAEAGLGNEKLAAGDPEAAIKFIKAALKDAPKPIPDQLFDDMLSKFPPNLYFRGLRDEGFEIARILERKAEASASQLLNIANFYLSIENGSEARRVTENAIKIEPNSSSAYQTLGLANRLDFKLEESAAAYTKALELEPDSLQARRGLAEMKRSLGKAEEAIALYREIIAKDDANVPARTGLILALFDADKRADAEDEITKSLEANPGNVVLLAGAAYWYAAHNEGALAVASAQKAIKGDPRFIWSHIALARGLLIQNRPSDAERALLAARQYGNFPTLEYEIASARLAAGLYREAAEELSKSFTIKDGMVHANLGGRVPYDAKNFTDLIGFERKASLFTPTAAGSADGAAELRALLEFEQELRSPEPRSDIATNAIDEFLRSEDKMKVYRQLFAASELLEKKVALPKVLEITKAAPADLEVGLDIPEPSTAVMASELYENRAIAAASGRYINVPNVPRPTLSAVLRGRIEEITGWASFQMGDAAQAVVHLKRAVGVLPVDSAWWRSSTWRLGTALTVGGNDAEALEAYIKSYKSSGADAIRYNTIAALYKRVKGNTLGLEERVGADPSAPAPAETLAQKIEPTPDTAAVPIKTESVPPDTIPQALPAVQSSVAPTPNAIASVESTPEASPKPTLSSTRDALKTPEKDLTVIPSEKRPETTPKELFPPVVIIIPAAETSKTAVKTEATPIPSPTAVENKPSDESRPLPATSPTQSPLPTPEVKPAEPTPTAVTTADKKSDDTAAVVEPTPQPTAEVKPCTLIVDIENITLKNNEGVLAVVVRREGDQELDELKAVSTSPQDVSVRREVIEDLKTQALFVMRSVSTKTGIYHVTFELPCGKKEVMVKVQ